MNTTLQNDFVSYSSSTKETELPPTQDHFYITAHGVDGIRLRVDSPTIDPLVLKMKLLQFIDVINKTL